MRARVGLIHQYVAETFGEEAVEKIPSYGTLRVVWQEWFGTGRARQGCARSALLETTGEHVIVERPGQVVALDTTVLLRETVFDDPVTVCLTLAMDVYTHSLVGRLTLVSDTSTDVAMLLRDVTMPLPMRADWGEDMEWPYPGVPAALVAEFAGPPPAVGSHRPGAPNRQDRTAAALPASEQAPPSPGLLSGVC